MYDPDLLDGHDTLILGIGNLLWADEGFGVRCVEELYRTHAFGPRVRLMDGGTQGLYLVQYVQHAENLLVFDAIDWGDPPGTVRVVRDDEVPAFMGVKKMSLHQTGFQEVLAAAELLGGKPRRQTLIGVQAEELDDWGGPLRPLIRQRMKDCIELALDELATWGVAAARRPEPLPPEQGLLGHDLSLDAYERRAAE